MTDTKPNNELAIAVQEFELEQSKVETLMASFGESFQTAKRLSREAKAIKVEDENDVETMTKAREYRLALRATRIEADKTRESLKAQALREGNAIQGAYNIIKALIVPVEEYLESQEKFVELKLKAEADAKYNERVAKLQPYIEDLSVYSLRDMTEEAFTNLLDGAKMAHQKKLDEQKKLEEERLAKEKAEREEQERIRLENEKLRKEAEEREKKAEAERKAQEEKEAKLKAEQEAKLQAEREKREAIEKKLREQAEAKEAERKAKEEAERQALLAPDKEKLIALAVTLDTLPMPSVKSREAGQIIEQTLGILAKVSAQLREKAKAL